ncbi:Pyrroline-5-carboxylate reductase [Macrophomina phaseolina MS6]|uniref:Pyrroline-5-carboxylate reductase n=1 Tax=Macrophomina phaseolina (strain MS6) TaxID=1126212 RepID=K2RI57_MACPH|nr:Pyrroline-5-carboxylate reductase [Macrophomina phaseolina MS6]
MAGLERATTLCVLGCGNLGTAILTNLLEAGPGDAAPLPFTRFVACVRSEKSEQALQQRFSQHSTKLSVCRGDNTAAVDGSDVVILGADPADVDAVLTQPGMRAALGSKLLLSLVAGWPRTQLETTLYGSATTPSTAPTRARIVRTLPNIAAAVGQSLTAIEMPADAALLPDAHLALTERIFQRIGRTQRIAPKLMDATTALAGSTPAFFAVICDALVDAGVAVGVPRDQASAMIFQAMRGTAALLQEGGVHPGVLKDQGTSPEGCTIGGLMVLEEAGVRGHLGRALREAVTVARLMGKTEHVNDTRQ